VAAVVSTAAVGVAAAFGVVDGGAEAMAGEVPRTVQSVSGLASDLLGPTVAGDTRMDTVTGTPATQPMMMAAATW